MFIRVQFRDFEISSGRHPLGNKICYWVISQMDISSFLFYLSKEGYVSRGYSVDKNQFETLEEVEEALSLYYKSPIKLEIPRTHKELL